MKFNAFRFAGGCVGGAVWFLAAAFVKHEPTSTILMVCGFAAVLLGLKAAWVKDARPPDDPVE